MKLKELNPKYKKIELSASDKEMTYSKIIGCRNFKACVQKYGNSEVLHVVDYDSSHTTNVIIKDNNYKTYLLLWRLKYDHKNDGTKTTDNE